MKGRIFVIGASLSGIDALTELVSKLPKPFPAPIFIAQHVASHSPGMLPYLLSKAGPLPAVHPKNATLFERGIIYVAPPDRHMLIQKGYIRLSHGPHENLARPAIDPLFRSAAATYGPAVVGVVLTGQLNDGTSGLLAIKDCGGYTIVQEPREATARSMPLSAIRHMKVDKVCTLDEMARLFIELAFDDPPGDRDERLPSLMEIENRIAEGIFKVDDWWALEQLSIPSGLNCPTCRSALYELKDQRVLRYRCRSGHGFSAQSLLSGQAEARENYLSSLFGAVIEEATLAKRLGSVPVFADDTYTAESLLRRVAGLDRQADQVSEWLHAMTDLVEPEPSMGPPAV
ncbi:MAG: chemotaxis protein CheB [Mesorhizobium sp.]|uniref:chemotaxis protein CheB n=1 Tax=Mesorhizobium sp. TaxID=1871066 RepID=UPI000FE86737|nr:chemotaxis protein CheB [Mesorhizobium sp.]RWB73035.1 MAG: chemotaxis protein CheB [Mesorhizobium sp.]